MSVLSPLEETTNTLEYLIREFESYGVIDAINMRHAYEAAAIGRRELRKGRCLDQLVGALRPSHPISESLPSLSINTAEGR